MISSESTVRKIGGRSFRSACPDPVPVHTGVPQMGYKWTQTAKAYEGQSP